MHVSAAMHLVCGGKLRRLHVVKESADMQRDRRVKMMNRVSLVLAAALLGGVVTGVIVATAMSASERSAGADSTYQFVDAGVQGALPPSEADAMARLNGSPRHGEWVTVTSGPNDSTRAWVVYPQRSDKAPVVIVVHEIFGLTPWVRAVADQLAADGFIAVAPDFLTMKNVPGTPAAGPERNAATAAIRDVTPAEVNRRIDALARYAMALPAALPRYGIVGYCWGGAASFAHAVHSPSLGAAVVYYGTSPATATLSAIRAPVLGLYAANDARVNATVPPADSAMKALGKQYVVHMFEGAGHGFLRQSNEANVAASLKAWPLTIQFFKTHLEAR
jgi:carboxymethylenebutenolidase